MPNPITLGGLFELAIAAEQNAAVLYGRFAQLFAAYPEVAEFWRDYARQEDAHAEWLTQLLESMDDEQLRRPTAPIVLQNAQRLLSISLDRILANVHDLEDAYQLATEMENGETNAVFEFLTEYAAPTERLRVFLRVQLKDHLGKLMVDFPLEFRSMVRRREIQAMP